MKLFSPIPNILNESSPVSLEVRVKNNNRTLAELSALGPHPRCLCTTVDSSSDVASHFPFTLLPFTLRYSHSRKQYSRPQTAGKKVGGSIAIIKKGKGGKYFRTTIFTGFVSLRFGGMPAWGTKTMCSVCAPGPLEGQAETVQQKVRKPVLFQLSSTLPPPREEAEETGGGAGCYRPPAGGTYETGLRVPAIIYSQIGGSRRGEAGKTPQY